MKRLINKDNLKEFIDLNNGKTKPVKSILNKKHSTGKTDWDYKLWNSSKKCWNK